MPDSDTNVLIFVSINPVERFIELAWLTQDSNGNNYFENMECEFDLETVTHWQPLPSPPETE